MGHSGFRASGVWGTLATYRADKRDYRVIDIDGLYRGSTGRYWVLYRVGPLHSTFYQHCLEKQSAQKCRPLVNKPPPLNRDYNRDPYIKAFKGRGFINHGSTLVVSRKASQTASPELRLEMHG